MARVKLASLAFVILLPCAASSAEVPAVTGKGTAAITASAIQGTARRAAAGKSPEQARSTATVSDAPVTVGQLQELNQASKDQLDAVRKYAEERQKSVAAARSLAATASAIAARGGLATEEELKKVEDAKAALVAAAKNSAKLREKARRAQAAAQAAAARATTGRGVARGNAAMRVRETVDVEDPRERFLLLLPGGPLVVQAAISVDGQPFRTKREALVDELLAAADTDGDGKPTWAEGFQSSRFTLGRLQVTNDQQARQYLMLFDRNRDGLIDRGEVRAFLARYFQGGAFFLSTSAQPRGYGTRILANGRVVTGGGANANVQQLLDTDADGHLSKEEIAKAPDRLKSRDANDDDLLYPSEVAGSASSGRVQQTASGRVARPAVPSQMVTVMLGPTATAAELFAALTQRYRNDRGVIEPGSFSGVPGLFQALDADDDGLLQQSEMTALNSMEPHVEIQVALGENGGLTLDRMSAGLTAASETKNSLAMTLPGINLSFVANTAAPRSYDYSRTATSYLTRYDSDKNGYLDEKEVGNSFARLAQMWDADNDGKIFPKEIEASYRRTQAPLMSQVRASVVTQGNPLFSTLDLSGDGRLSLREMRTSPKRILTFDRNTDGEIDASEIPATIAITFAQGYGAYSYGRPVQRTGSPAVSRVATKNQPEWFTRMDRNGDGDVTLKEFLGEKTDFDKLDTNDDGFIEPAEARAAGKDSEE